MINMLDPVLQHLFAITADGDPEQHHCLDPMDVDNGPWQSLAVRSATVPAEQAPGTPPVAV